MILHSYSDLYGFLQMSVKYMEEQCVRKGVRVPSVKCLRLINSQLDNIDNCYLLIWCTIERNINFHARKAFSLLFDSGSTGSKLLTSTLRNTVRCSFMQYGVMRTGISCSRCFFLSTISRLISDLCLVMFVLGKLSHASLAEKKNLL